jgi:hypothetical protein
VRSAAQISAPAVRITEVGRRLRWSDVIVDIVVFEPELEAEVRVGALQRELGSLATEARLDHGRCPSSIATTTCRLMKRDSPKPPRRAIHGRVARLNGQLSHIADSP